MDVQTLVASSSSFPSLLPFLCSHSFAGFGIEADSHDSHCDFIASNPHLHILLLA